MHLPLFALDDRCTVHYSLSVDTKDTQPKTLTDTAITRTSINIPSEIWDQLRVKAIHEKMTAGEAVEAAIRLWVHESKAA